MQRKIFAVLGIVVLLMAMLVTVTSAAVGVDSSVLRDRVEVGDDTGGIQQHLKWLEGNGPRVAGMTGYDKAADYVASWLEDADYDVTIQTFTYDLWEELSDPVLQQIYPDPTTYTPYDVAGFATMEYSAAGDVTASVVKAANLGCDPADFTSANFNGKIALIERGVCNFSEKAINAENAGAVGAIVFNDAARQDAFLGTLGGPVVSIPVVGSSYAVGQQLIGEDVWVRMEVDSKITEDIETANVIAETPGGRDDRVVVVGAHLDTVAAGPGVNDNGSGVAMILEIAEQMAALRIEPRNKVRFAFWSAEESGLIGAQHYVDNLSKRELKNIALNLNFDMVASHNYVRFVYDGDGSDTPQAGPNGSGNIEDVFLEYFADQGLSVEATAFDGRSDYGPFIDAGIPAGGLFAGADEIRTEEQVAIYGGTAGEYLDPYYHTSGDIFDNIDEQALDELSDAAAHAILTFAMTTSSVNGTGKASSVAVEKMEYKGPKAQK